MRETEAQSVRIYSRSSTHSLSHTKNLSLSDSTPNPVLIHANPRDPRGRGGALRRKLGAGSAQGTQGLPRCGHRLRSPVPY